MLTELSGVIPPLLTPLTPEGSLDVPSLERLINHLLAAEVDGLFVLGSTGEAAFFEDTMRDQVLETVRAIVAGQVPILAGVIDMQTRRVREHITRAQRQGVDGIVATAPFYAITGPEEIWNHFLSLADHSDVPLLAYDLPQCVHTKLSPELLVALGREGAICGVKDSSGDDVSFRRLAQENDRGGVGLRLFTGHEVVVDGAYLAGAVGSVPGLANVEPAGYVRMHRAAMAQDWATVRLEQERLSALMDIAFVVRGKVGPAAGVGSFKTALVLLGVLTSNAMSAPMTALEDDNVAAIGEVLARCGLL